MAKKSGSKKSSSKKVETNVNSPVGQTTVAKTESRKYNFLIRTIWTFIMIGGFFAVLASGHIWCVFLVLLCQIAVFMECIAVTSGSSREKNLPLTKTLNWYFLITTIYYLEGSSLFRFIEPAFYRYPILRVIVDNHKFICYCFYVFGVVLFVCSLRKGHLKFQFASLCITHMVMLFVVAQAYLVTKNILNGLFWFLLPCGLVIVNDIFAYLCGITLGRTKLIAISPKKTLEGFLGAWFFTALASIILTRLLSPYMYLTCPVKDLNTNFFSNLTCDLNSVFLKQDYKTPPFISERYGIDVITVKPIYFHALNLATFASLVAPFGGFFASGLKRAFKVKDFGQTIPGHGGITDRIDCQILMGSFTYLYYNTFVSERGITVDSIISAILINLDERQIVEVLLRLSKKLYEHELLNKKEFKTIGDVYSKCVERL